jgi:hypothetical protein
MSTNDATMTNRSAAPFSPLGSSAFLGSKKLTRREWGKNTLQFSVFCGFQFIDWVNVRRKDTGIGSCPFLPGRR